MNAMMNSIAYIFPDGTKAERAFFARLADLLLELPNVRQQEDASLVIAATQPENALPVTIFAHADIPFPQLHFRNAPTLSLAVGNVHVNPRNANYQIAGKGFDRILPMQDALGSYYELQTAVHTIYRLPLDELTSRLKGHIVRIDHTGFNVPSALVTAEKWQQITQDIARTANFYKYPTGEDWPFILPATQAEYDAEIVNFVVGREPKFELVYDTYSPVPTIQIDIETDLLRSEVEKLLPSPYGISFPGLANFFRTVYVHHDWLGLDIRFDVRFKNNTPDGDWETGKWLVNEGGRIA